ncbi:MULTISPECIES: aa3-type cytochrome c oxidase subunit IV [Ahrensia]|uniref:Aa3-type cytochrome c oxidase subunit IV n=1 Tax=Ahrensia kielensis TaxID=76980 RepID=A0ABU9TA73_9HYPH|nr:MULTISPECIES: aa3-type cytochrome c oxidase subunit IV [Ahrensia]
MADTKTSNNENIMDYAEHDRTYSMFLIGAKWVTIVSCAILIGMAFGFFAGAGLIGGTLVAIICVVLAKFLA